MLIQNRFADVGRFRDLVHGGPVISVGDEDFLGSGQQLGPALVARQPGRPLSGGTGGAGGGVRGLSSINRCMMNHCWPSFHCSYLHFTRG